MANKKEGGAVPEVTAEKKKRTPRSIDSITTGALKLPLTERIGLVKTLKDSIMKEVEQMQSSANAATELLNGLGK